MQLEKGKKILFKQIKFNKTIEFGACFVKDTLFSNMKIKKFIIKFASLL